MQLLRKCSRIAIIGGGISGLALALSLKIKGFDHVSVFEKDQSF